MDRARVTVGDVAGMAAAVLGWVLFVVALCAYGRLLP